MSLGSFERSSLGAFVQSPLKARNTKDNFGWATSGYTESTQYLAVSGDGISWTNIGRNKAAQPNWYFDGAVYAWDYYYLRKQNSPDSADWTDVIYDRTLFDTAPQGTTFSKLANGNYIVSGYSSSSGAGKIYRSEDQGNTWVVAYSWASGYSSENGIWPCVNGNSITFLITSFSADDAYFVYSEDGGINWTKTPKIDTRVGTGYSPTFLFRDAVTGYLYYGVYSYYYAKFLRYYSTDFSKTWTYLGYFTPVSGMAMLRHCWNMPSGKIWGTGRNPSAGYNTDLFYTTDLGGTWTKKTLTNAHTTFIVRVGNTFYWMNGKNLYRSDDEFTTETLMSSVSFSSNASGLAIKNNVFS